ncbi:MAG: ABC transporter substrate-binding protein [Chloroflexota bacterium]
MRQLWKVLSTVLLMLVAVAVVAAGCAPAAETVVEKEKTVKVGLSLLMTGPIATTGVPISEAYLDYLRYVNDELGGVAYTGPDGKAGKVTLDVLWEDNAYSVPKGLSIYKRQKAAGVMVRYILSSSEAEALVETIAREHMPTVGINASPVMMAAKPRYFIPGYAAYADQVGGIARWIAQDWKGSKPAKVGVIMLDVPAVRVAAKSMTPEKMAPLGVELVGLEWVSGAVTDSTIELTRLKDKGTEYLVVMHIVGGATVIIKDVTRLGLRGQMKLVQQQIGTDESLIKLLGDAAEGVYMQGVNAWPSEDLSGVKLARRVTQKYRGHDLSVLTLIGWYSAAGMVEGVRLALNKVGYENLTREAINEGMMSIKGFDTGGVVPPITIDPNYPVLNEWMKMAVVQGGKLVPVGDWVKCPQVETRE